MAKQEIRDPILLKHAQDEFGLGRKWFKLRIDRGEIRWQKVGRHVVLERDDVKKLAPDAVDQTLVDQAIRAHKKRTDK